VGGVSQKVTRLNSLGSGGELETSLSEDVLLPGQSRRARGCGGISCIGDDNEEPRCLRHWLVTTTIMRIEGKDCYKDEEVVLALNHALAQTPPSAI